jgi:hypothetical protein
MNVRRYALSLTTAALAASLGGLASQASAATAHAPGVATPACTTIASWIGLPGDGYAGGQVVQLEFSNIGTVTCTLGVSPAAYLLVGSPHWLNSCLSSTAACFPSVFLTMRIKLTRHA